MNPDESPTIEQLVERMPTDRVLALLIQQLLELQAEVELLREMVSGQPGMPDEKRIRERRISIASAIIGEWRARVEGDGAKT
jgi:hypothetical protein